MKKPKEWSPILIDMWRQSEEIKRLRRELLGIESYGWNGNELKEGEENGNN